MDFAHAADVRNEMLEHTRERVRTVMIERHLESLDTGRVLNNHHSVILNDLTTGLRLGKYHIDHLKKFVPRTKNARQEGLQLAEWAQLHCEFCQEAHQEAPRDRRAGISI